MITPRTYQQEIIDKTISEIKKRKTLLVQLPTGAGKTVVFCQIIKQLTGRIWVIAPRNELIDQASAMLDNHDIEHGRIDAKNDESALLVHVVSKDTLIRRKNKIRNKPDYIFVDECHLALDRYIEIKNLFKCKIIGFTATPERLDGKGLKDLYGKMISGPDIGDLVDMGHLSDITYYCPPANTDMLEIFENRRIYGDALKHYEKHCNKVPALVFCRSIEDSIKTADEFSTNGLHFLSIDGGMSATDRKTRIDALVNGEIDGLTSCELLTYGLDIPRVGAIIMLRPTMSRTTYFQMIGRGLRPYEGKETCHIFDHVGNIYRHQYPLDKQQWNFEGKTKRRAMNEKYFALRLCPENDFLYCSKTSCIGCEHNTSGRTTRPLEQVNVDLEKFTKQVNYSELENIEKIAYNSQIEDCRKIYLEGNTEKAVSLLDDIRQELNRKQMWIYYALTKGVFDKGVLIEIAKQRNYKPGWVYMQSKKLLQNRW